METKGDFGVGKATELTGKVGGLKKVVHEVSDAVGSISTAFTGAIERVGQFAMKWGTVAAIGAVGAITYGVMGLNKELENTRISLGAIFSAQGVSSDITAGMVQAGSVMEQMRKDAAALPGEFDDLRQIFMTIATPALASGMNVDQLRAMASQTMAVGAVMGIQSDQTAREMAMLLEGRAGGRNVLGMRLGFMGDKAHELQQADAGKRVEMVNKELAKYAPAIAEFQKSWEGIYTTTTSNVKMLLAKVTSPLFDSMKSSLSFANDWFDHHSASIETFALKLGDRLAYAFNRGLSAVELWYPAIRDFAVHAYDEIASVWERVEPAVARIGESIRGFLSDKESLTKLEHVLELYGAVKVGGMAMSVAGPAFGIGSSIMGALGAGGGAAGGGEVAGGMAAGLGEAAAALGPIAAALAIAVAGFYGAEHAITDSSAVMHETAISQWASIKGAWSEFTATMGDAWDTVKNSIERVTPLVVDLADIFGTLLVTDLRAATGAIDWFLENSGIKMVARAAAMATATLNKTPNESLPGQDAMPFIASGILEIAKDNKDQRRRGVEHPGGTTNIKVEIVATSVADPNRVAKLVMNEFQQLRRHRLSSPDVPNWSAARP